MTTLRHRFSVHWMTLHEHGPVMRRTRERKGLENGTMTSGYNIPAKRVVKLLNKALATETTCVPRYKRHNFMAAGIDTFSS